MDLNEQAGAAVDELSVEAGLELSLLERRVAKMIWLNGYKAGMEAVTAIVADVTT